MCTAISMHGKHHYFGRNLDLTYHYDESVTITPRNYSFDFLNQTHLDTHYAIIGIATVADNYPLYYDAVNECGVGICALNFPGNAAYIAPRMTAINIASYEVIPWLLSQYTDVKSIKKAISSLNITNQAFNEQYEPTPLHWLIADAKESIVLEQTDSGLMIYENPIHVLTNNPPFNYHLKNINNYMNLTANETENRFSDHLHFDAFSIGMGGIGLPGDLSSPSRFVRAAFHLHNATHSEDSQFEINQFFHILKSVEQVEGSAKYKGNFEKTIYSCCCDTENGIYFYTTYQNSCITQVNMHHENLAGKQLTSYPLRMDTVFCKEN